MTGAGPLRSRLHAAAARGLTRFIGREAELEQVRQAIGRAAAGSGQVVALVGEPGVGKSRLVWEVTHSHRTHGWLIVEAGSSSYGKATPYLPVIDLLKGYFQVEDRDEPRKMREKVTGKILTLDRALEPTLPALLSLLEVPVEDAAWRTLDPPQRRQRTLDALKRLLLREAQDQPVLVVFEDLHWIDGETQALLDGVVESLPAARLMLLVNYRPEYEHRWGRKTYYTQLRLDPLPPESAGELLQALLGGDPSLQPLTRLLIERTEGNPFFLEESVRTLVETGALIGGRGAYRLGGPTAVVQVPATVQAVLAARIDRLPPEEKRLLQTAAVIGKDVPDGGAPGRRRDARGGPSARTGAPPGRRVPVRDEPVPRAGVHVQARADPRGGLREPAPRPATRPARCGSWPPWNMRASGRALAVRGAARPPRVEGRGVGARRAVSPSRRSAGHRASAIRERRRLLRGRDPRPGPTGRRVPT